MMVLPLQRLPVPEARSWGVLMRQGSVSELRFPSNPECTRASHVRKHLPTSLAWGHLGSRAGGCRGGGKGHPWVTCWQQEGLSCLWRAGGTRWLWDAVKCLLNSLTALGWWLEGAETCWRCLALCGAVSGPCDECCRQEGLYAW